MDQLDSDSLQEIVKESDGFDFEFSIDPDGEWNDKTATQTGCIYIIGVSIKKGNNPRT